jgi:hypothetical protein
MGNDISCKFVGICSIQINMFDGSVKILTDVRHVPELMKNLISLGVLDTGGYKSIVQGGVMKAYKGILLVMKENKVGNMFFLKEEPSQIMRQLYLRMTVILFDCGINGWAI